MDNALFMSIKKFFIFAVLVFVGNAHALKIDNKKSGKKDLSKLAKPRSGRSSIKMSGRLRRGSSKGFDWYSNASAFKKLAIGGACLGAAGLIAGGIRFGVNYYQDDHNYQGNQVQLFAYQEVVNTEGKAVAQVVYFDESGHLISDTNSLVKICGFDSINQVFVSGSFWGDYKLFSQSQILGIDVNPDDVGKFLQLECRYGTEYFSNFITFNTECCWGLTNIYLNVEDGMIYYFAKNYPNSYFGLFDFVQPNDVDFYSINNKNEWFYDIDETMNYYLSSSTDNPDLIYKPVTFKVNFGEQSLKDLEKLLSMLVDRFIKQVDVFCEKVSEMNHPSLNGLSDYEKFQFIFDRERWNECIGINHLAFLLNQSQKDALVKCDKKISNLSKVKPVCDEEF